jgi:hypothetical protein
MKHAKFSVMAALFVVAVGSIAMPDASACSISQFELNEKEPLPRYTMVLFHKPGEEASEKSLATMSELKKTWSERANIDFEAIDIASERGEKIAKYWQVKETPTTFVIAPTGWSLAMMKGKLDSRQIAPLMSSPGKAALLKALEKNKAVFLVLGKKGMKGFENELKAVAAAVKTVKDTMKIQATTLTLDPTDPREARLLQNFGLTKPPAEAVTYVVFGKGRVVLEDLEIKDTAERLAFTVQLLSTADQCSLGNEIFGEPLLLGK